MDVICKHTPDESVEEKTKTLSKDEEIIVCGFCNHHITDPTKQITVNDSFRHVFANPHGIVFEIGCFSGARGCKPVSISSNEFSWFVGFSWQICVCSYCSAHLGWVFKSDSSKFYGLILEKLIFP